MQRRKRTRSLFNPRAELRASADSSGNPGLSAPALNEQQELEHEFLERYLTLADIALSAPPNIKRKEIA